MGFQLSAVVSSPVTPARKLALYLAARRRWPFLRLPRRDTHPERLLLGSIERTSYLLRSDEAAILALLFDDLLEAELPALAREFADVDLAFVHTDCFGGGCVSYGQVWRDGVEVLASEELGGLLGAVGLESNGEFAGFERDYFGAPLDPRVYAGALGPGFAVGVGEVTPAEPSPSLPLRAPGPIDASELAAAGAEPRRLRVLAAALIEAATGKQAVIGPLAGDHPLVFADVAGVDPTWVACVAAGLSAPPVDLAEGRRRVAAAVVGDGAWLSTTRGAALDFPPVQPSRLRVLLPEAPTEDEAARVGAAVREHLQQLVEVAPTIEVIGPGALLPCTIDPIPAALWTERALAEARGGPALEPIEGALIEALDRDHRDHRDQDDQDDQGAREALAVVGDWLAQRSDTGEHGRLLTMDLRARALAEAGEDEAATALRRQLQIERRRLWSQDEQELEVIVRHGDSDDRPRLGGDWWPQLWASWCGPWLIRLAVRSAWRTRFDQRPALLDEWQRHSEPQAAYLALLRIFALPCARYLGARRVSLLHAPATPDLSGRSLADWTLRELNLTEATLQGASFVDARLEDCLLHRADLRGADLRRALLRAVDLRGADLREADLRGARLLGVDLRGADLRGAILDDLRCEQVELFAARVGPEQQPLLARAGAAPSAVAWLDRS